MVVGSVTPPDPYRLRFIRVLRATMDRLTVDAVGHSRSVGHDLGVELTVGWEHCMAAAAGHLSKYIEAVEAAAAKVEEER